MQISIITSLFNRLDLTRACLRSLEDTLRGWRYEIILIDDVSTDGTREFLAGLTDPRYRVILNDAPRSFAANNNAGARLARAPLLCFLNNDTVLLPGWLEPMAALAGRVPDVAVVGNVQREPVSGLIDHHGIFFDPEGYAIHAGKGAVEPPSAPYLSWPALTAACWVIRKDVFLRLDGFDEKFHNGSEDLDFCLRAASAGYRHFAANRSVIFHHISASPGRKQREDANLRLFRERWREWLARAVRTRRSAADLRSEGRRYLLKHLLRPWRYNRWRLVDALEKIFLPRPESREPGLLARWVLRSLPPPPAPTPQEAADPVHWPPVTRIFLVVGHTVRDTGHGGVSTLVRGLAAAFGRLGLPVRLVTWDAASRTLLLLPQEWSLGADAESLRDTLPDAVGVGSTVSLYDPRVAHPHDPSARYPALHEITRYVNRAYEGWVLMPEILYGPGEVAHLERYVHAWNWRLALIFHDAIPLDAPEFAAPGEPVKHAEFMHFFSEADVILPTSAWSARAWKNFIEPRGCRQSPVVVSTPGSDTFVHARVTVPPPPRDPAAPVRILSVSTVGARKNQRALLAAYDLAAAARPDLRLELLLAGGTRPSTDNFPAAIHEAMARHDGKIRWIERADYSGLRSFYEACDFTVYPSVMEGFGLPILESLWFGRPCVCANFGAMAEAAAGGGCLTVDVRDPQALADAMASLAGSPEARARLAAEARARPLKTWEDYAAEIYENLNGGHAA